jgi:hypothetical protein
MRNVISICLWLVVLLAPALGQVAKLRPRK